MLRILHCPENIGAHPATLARAERELGLDSRCVTLRPHPFGYPADEVLSRGGMLGMQVARWRLLQRALSNCDIVHFNFGQSCMPQRIPLQAAWDPRFPRWVRRVYNAYAAIFELRDLAWLKQRGKRIVVTYQGDDARQGDELRARFALHPADEAGYYSPESDRQKRGRIQTFGRFADAIFALNPDLLHVLPARARFLPYANVDVRKIQPVSMGTGSRPVVLHAPSHQGVKGTRFIVDAVARLKAEGVPFEFELVEGLPHAEAMRLYARADLLVDQVLTGWYGGLAVELMALGKPVIAYVREGDLGFLPPAMRAALPLVSATPATIYSVLKEYLTTRRADLPALGARSRQYAENWHDPRGIAAALKSTYEEAMRCAA